MMPVPASAFPDRVSLLGIVDIVIRALLLLGLGLIFTSARSYFERTADLNPAVLQPLGNHAYGVQISRVLSNPCGWELLCPMSGDTNDVPFRSDLRLFENGTQLGPAHATHADIAAQGGGRYSHWNDYLIFSTSDGSDPRENKRHYTVGDQPRFGRLVGVCLIGFAALLAFRQRRGVEYGLAEVRVAVRSLQAAGGSLRSLRYASWLTLRAVMPVAITTAGLFAAAYLAAQADPDRGFYGPGVSVDTLIVKAQRERAGQLRAPEVALVGDSSCLMGIDASLLGSELKRSVESLCSLAYLGPRGYAALVKMMMARGATPGRLIIVFHPVQFQRDPSWDSWIEMLNAGPRPPAGFEWTLDYARRKWLDRAFYQPLPRNYGLYYGSAHRFEAELEMHSGSAVDPSAALDVPSLTLIQGAARHRPTQTQASDDTLNDPFREALKELAVLVARIGADRTYLLITPVDDNRLYSEETASLANSIRQISVGLGIPSDHVLNMPRTMPAPYFATGTHLNRWGRRLYTEELAKLLRERF